ncbi:unnamed protein product [Gongylonema pulchrum]|uniref:Translocation protein SEC62 n=1 Tax=Gongylonema pulchrum TaxID=637853 RepID=A0A3P7QCT7_9BILA|nr:unnamed protein product [Gongylonema pulchrum]
MTKEEDAVARYVRFNCPTKTTMFEGNEQNQKLTKEEDAVARYVRFNCPTKTTMFEGNEVHYFTGAKAVDTLYESKKYGHAAKNVKFPTRQAAVMFMRTLLEKGLLFRARKLVPKKRDDKDLKEKARGDASKSPKKKPVKEGYSEKEKKEEGKKESDENEDENEKEKGEKKKKDEEEKKKRKVKLELHQEQTFNDSNDVYVWIFDPTPLFKKVIGALMVLGTIAGCLFPLWPMWLRQAVYYLSIAGLACFGLLIGVAVARTILFAIIWAVTMGRHKLWLLPNLTEDCGFFESFQPWYTYEYCPGGIIASGKKKKKTTDGKKKSDDEEPLLDKSAKAGDQEKSVKDENLAERKSQKTVSEQGKNAGAGNGELGNGDESDETDEESDGSSNSDDKSSEESGGSATNIGEQAGDARGDTRKARLRRRVRKADDDFILVDK